jgi:hypothetical protein
LLSKYGKEIPVSKDLTQNTEDHESRGRISNAGTQRSQRKTQRAAEECNRILYGKINLLAAAISSMEIV